MEELREMLKNITLIDNPQQLKQNEIIIDHSSSSEEEPDDRSFKAPNQML